MRKSILVTILAVMALLVPCQVDAQLQLGVKGGFNLTRMALDTDIVKNDRSGFFIGPTVRLGIPIFGLGLDLSALYDERDTRVGDDPVVDLKQKMVSVPLNLRKSFGFEDAIGFFVYAGPQLDFNINDKEKMLDSVSSWKYRDSQFSVNVGGGITLMRDFQLSINYNIVCGETADIHTVQDVADQVKDYKAKTHAWQFALALYF